MALIVFFRGVNVGGYRRFRPSILAEQLAAYDVVNVGAAGTLIVRKPGSRTRFAAELRKRLPFHAELAFCSSSELIELEKSNPFGAGPVRSEVIRFVSILCKGRRRKVSLPMDIPANGQWLVRITGCRKRLVFGLYRRRMKAIGYLGQLDKLFGVPATTRGWNTILSVLHVLKAPAPNSPGRQPVRARQT